MWLNKIEFQYHSGLVKITSYANFASFLYRFDVETVNYLIKDIYIYISVSVIITVVNT